MGLGRRAREVKLEIQSIPFTSILFDRTNVDQETRKTPTFFTGLYLDQIIDAITANHKEYNLNPFFTMPLRDAETIYYRHAVMRDMEDANLMAHIKVFSEKMTSVRRYLGLEKIGLQLP
jgi:DNA mismatch repair protein MutS